MSLCSEDVTVLQDCPGTLSSPSPAPITLGQKSVLGVGSGSEVVGFSSPEMGVRGGPAGRVLGGRGSRDDAAAKHRMYDWRHASKALKRHIRHSVHTNTGQDTEKKQNTSAE